MVVTRPPESPAAEGFVPPAGEPGLTSAQVATLREEHGLNLLVPKARRSGLLVALYKSLTEPMVLLLIVASGVYLATGDLVDAVVTGVALVPIAAVGLILESRSSRALERLRALTTQAVRVLRDG